jgi:DNA polymerase-3 subunit gamma/tau
VTALTNALTRGRLHHAYLLTGTRGVGKTTIARLLAKSLNCITNGVTATPCGTCAACTEIDAGRFVDLLELDAASNTGIDNMREILDNARYAPTVGRFKVYLIDEVHMLSKAAFNSMLKTLEEPPEHVKFVLATTDPQKIPVTVLSRCLQFNLKQLPPQLIAERLTAIIAAEKIGADAPALALLARAAHGSMRDALSLLDQAIAYGDGEFATPWCGGCSAPSTPSTPTGSSTRSLRTTGRRCSPRSMRWRRGASRSVLRSKSSHRFFHRSPSPRQCRMRRARSRTLIACARSPSGSHRNPSSSPTRSAYRAARPRVGARRSDGLFDDALAAPRVRAREPQRDACRRRTVARASRRASDSSRNVAAAPTVAAVRPIAAAQPTAPATSEPPAHQTMPSEPAAWPSFVAGLNLAPMAAQLAGQTELKSIEGNVVTLALPATHKHLADKAYSDRLKTALDAATGRKWMLAFEVGSKAESSLAAQRQREQAEAKAKTEAAFRSEPFVQDALARFDAKVRPDSIKPVS